MPDYSSMEVDQLKTLLHAYGIRPGQKRYMVDKLSEVWLRLQAASSAQTQDPDAQRKAEAEAERAELKKRQRSALQEERDKRTLVAAVEALRCHVLLYERILLMDSLSLDEVADALAEEGVRISMRLLSHLLNELGVPYTHGPPRCNKLLNAALAAPQAD
jgi:transposase